MPAVACVLPLVLFIHTSKNCFIIIIIIVILSYISLNIELIHSRVSWPKCFIFSLMSSYIKVKFFIIFLFMHQVFYFFHLPLKYQNEYSLRSLFHLYRVDRTLLLTIPTFYRKYLLLPDISLDEAVYSIFLVVDIFTSLT